jgi:hypothetical protein
MQLTGPMDEVLTGLAGQDDELDGLVAGLDEGGWATPSRCPGWSVADVVLHLAQTDEMAAALGRERAATAALRPIARLAWRTLPYAFARAGRRPAGPVALALTAPDGTVWEFRPDGPASTTIAGPALDFCLVAARRTPPWATALEATGPDGDAVLELVRTFA